MILLDEQLYTISIYLMGLLWTSVSKFGKNSTIGVGMDRRYEENGVNFIRIVWE